MNVNVSRHDIFDYVVGHATYDPIEKCIDPTIYETYGEYILHIETQEYIHQNEDYCWFYKEMLKLKIKAVDMHTSEILRLCEEIEEIAPKTVNL